MAAFQTTLAEARDLRDKWRKVLMDGRNPIEARARLVRPSDYVLLSSLRRSHPNGAMQSIKANGAGRSKAMPRPVDKVDTGAVLAVLTPIWQSIPETASRLRGRVEAVLDFAKARGS